MITEYNFLKDINAIFLEEYAENEVVVVLVGKHTNLLRPKFQRVRVGWKDMYTFATLDSLVWTYPKRIRPTSRWPWPFRNFTRRPTVVLEGFELYTKDALLLFRLPIDGTPRYLAPRDRFEVAAGDLRIKI